MGLYEERADRYRKVIERNCSLSFKVNTILLIEIMYYKDGDYKKVKVPVWSFPAGLGVQRKWDATLEGPVANRWVVVHLVSGFTIGEHEFKRYEQAESYMHAIEGLVDWWYYSWQVDARDRDGRKLNDEQTEEVKRLVGALAYETPGLVEDLDDEIPF
jgi:hypothetical protein